MTWQPEFPVLIVDDELHDNSAVGKAIRATCAAIEGLGHVVLQANTEIDGEMNIASHPELGCLMVDWDLGRGDAGNLIAMVRARSENVPIFLLTERTALPSVPLEIIRQVNDFAWKLQDTSDFIAGRVDYAVRRYSRGLLPPFFFALVDFARHYEYSWHTPGHSGGAAFRKSPAGMAFYEFFGERLLRSDLSNSVEELGSLLDHSGAVGEAERYAAKVFGSDLTYFVTNGTSTSNRIVLQASVCRDEVVAVDRNCHKSIEQGLTLTGAIPIYLIPTRNNYGIIGPIHPGELEPDALRRKLASNPLVPSPETACIVHSVITNSTYDGIIYDVKHVSETLGLSTDRIHYDEAWFAYARFHPLYAGRYGMHDDPNLRDSPTVFATQSTHKLLAALSQASMIHVKNRRVPITHLRFNEAFMMHSSTSPQYAIIASNDVATKMMAGASGPSLVGESITEAIAFRKMIARIGSETSPDWFFKVWQPDRVKLPQTGEVIPFKDVTDDYLCSDARCWMFDPDEAWHGFEGLPMGYGMLDPTKVTLLTPGIDVDGAMMDIGIPAPVVTKFLDTRGIIAEKTGDYCILFLFSIGITKGKWGTLIDSLFEFKRLFDERAMLEEVFPELVERHPEPYRGRTLESLCVEMHTFKRDTSMPKLLNEAFARLPTPAMPPSEAYRRLVHGEVEQVPVAEMAGRVSAVGVVPYPPGIPVLMPGERAGGEAPAVLDYLRALQDFDSRFPGFAHAVHGVEFSDGAYRVLCVADTTSSRRDRGECSVRAGSTMVRNS